MSAATNKDAAGLSGRFVLAGGVMIFAIGQSLLFIIVAPLARSIGFSDQLFGLAFSIANITLIFASPFWGKKSDVIGRKPVFTIGLFGSAIGTLFMALTLQAGLSGVLTTWSLFGLIVFSRGVYGLTASAIYPAASAYIADVTQRQDRGKGMALIGGANSLGSILGPALGGGLAFLGVLVPMYAAVAISFFGGIAAIFYLLEPARHRERRAADTRLKFSDPRLRPYMIMWACFFVVFISLNIVTAYFVQDRLGIDEPAARIRIASLALTSMAVVITIVQGVVFQRFHVSPRTLLRLCGPAYSAGLLIIAFAYSTTVLMIGFGVIGLAFSCATPGINGSASLAMKPHEQGAAAGYLAAANTVGAIIGPVLGTSIYQLQENAPMLFGAALFLIISVYAMFIPEPEEHPE